MSADNPTVPGPGLISGVSLVRLKRTVRLGMRSLWLHRLRSLLTALGIVFGVCSVIAMLAIGEGASFEAQEQIKSLGSQNIILSSIKPSEEQKVSDQGSQSFVLDYGITYNDVKRIHDTIPGVTVVLPARKISDYVWNISRRVDCEIVCTVPWYPQMRNLRVRSGHFFTDIDMAARSSVCVLGADMVSALFPLESPLGKHVRVGGDYYQVIGVMEPRGAGPKPDESQLSKDNNRHQMFIPLETAMMRYGDVRIRYRSGSIEAERVELHEATVKVNELENVISVSEAVRHVMERNHKKKDYQMDVPLEMLKRAERTKQIFNIVLGSIAAISLLVGGIGIMNIMLASITERTREIGIRRALGARRRDIVVQFLVETVILSGAGGILGVLLGVMIPFMVTHLAGMRTIVTFWSPLLAFTISGLVGVVFGIYPAMRAAKMDPVEALRHE